MNTFLETLSLVGAIAIVLLGTVMVLTLFFRTLSWISGAGSKPETMAIRGVLKKNTYAKVHLTSGETFDRVRFVGFTNIQTLKTHLPYELNGMVILEDEQKQRTLVRAKNIRMIVVAADADSG